MIVVDPDRALGDAICALPALSALAESIAPEKLYFFGPQHLVFNELWDRPPNVRDILALPVLTRTPFPEIENAKRLHEVRALSIGNGRVDFRHMIMHPTAHIFEQAQLPVPERVVDTMPVNSVVANYAPDFLIAPFTSDQANIDGRLWPLKNWPTVVSLVRQQMPEATFTFIGTRRDSTTEELYLEPPATLQLDMPLPGIVGLMRATRYAVVTMDSAPNRLAHAAGIRNHILIASDRTPLVWHYHPGANVIDGKLETLTPETVAAAMLEVAEDSGWRRALSRVGLEPWVNGRC